MVVALKRLVESKEVMHAKEAAAFMGIGMTSLYKCQAPFHQIKGIAGLIYLRSELIEVIKKH